MIPTSGLGSHTSDLQHLRAAQERLDKVDTLARVGEFRDAFGFHPDPPYPAVPDLDYYCAETLRNAAVVIEAAERLLQAAAKQYVKPPSCLLTVQLIAGELIELARAMAAHDMVACLDALLDLRYVNDGAVHALGLVPFFYEGFRLVHESNMSKRHPDGTVHKDASGKVIKGDWYKPVDLEQLFK